MQAIKWQELLNIIKTPRVLLISELQSLHKYLL